MIKTTFILNITNQFSTLSVEVDENKTLKECLDIANELGKNAGSRPYRMEIKRCIVGRKELGEDGQ